jgi:hypothetical protein
MQKWSLQTHNHKFPWFLYPLFVFCFCHTFLEMHVTAVTIIHIKVRLQFHYCPMWHKSHKANFIQ